MYEKLENYVQNVPDFFEKTSSEMILYFVYYCLYFENLQQVRGKQIEECYAILNLKAYSNIPSYMSKHAKGKKILFIKGKMGYTLEHSQVDKIKKEISEEREIVVIDELLSTDILDNAPYYIKAMAKQMNQCFECCLYDATFVMMRKIVETLIVECFERYGIEARIKDNQGKYMYLSDLIPRFIEQDRWSVSRNLESYMKKVKKYGDLSAHNRHFLAKKSDVKDVKFEMRQVIQEILLRIDYENWKKDA